MFYARSRSEIQSQFRTERELDITEDAGWNAAPQLSAQIESDDTGRAENEQPRYMPEVQERIHVPVEQRAERKML